MVEPLQKPPQKMKQQANIQQPVAAAVIPGTVVLKENEFNQIRALIYNLSGISMSPAKQSLVSNRLSKRLSACKQDSFGGYVRFITAKGNEAELQTAVDLLTTNETHFFREIKHFNFLQQQVLPARALGRPFRVWSAACSSGEEPYSIAMLLADTLEMSPWEVLGSDISTRMLEKARSGVYPMMRAKEVPERFLKQYCLKGIGAHADSFIVSKHLRNQAQFMYLNLNKSLPQLGQFDVIFLRNVMIYFDMATKQQVVARMLHYLRPGGYFLVGHAETLGGGVNNTLKSIAPSIYRKPV